MAKDSKRQSKHKDASVAICSCHMCKPHKHGVEPSMRPSDARKVPNQDIEDQLEDYSWDGVYFVDETTNTELDISDTFMEQALRDYAEGKVYPTIIPMNQSAIDRLKAHKRIRKDS